MVRPEVGDVFVLTLTAPGDAVHHLPSGEVCPCTPAGGVDLGQWNGTLGKRWNRFMDALRDAMGDVQYFRAVEAQKRGALHLHVPLVLEVGQVVKLSEVRSLAMAHGFGHSVTLDRIPAGSRRAKRAGWYVAKYVSKASTDRELVPFVHPVTGEIGPGRWRTWTASRRWGASMASVRVAQREWAQAGGTEAADAGRQPDGLAGPKAPLDPNTLSYGTGPGATLASGVPMPM